VWQKQDSRVAQGLELLPSKCEAPSSNPSTTHKKRNTKNRTARQNMLDGWKWHHQMSMWKFYFAIIMISGKETKSWNK
jgi:hypothetical protein